MVQCDDVEMSYTEEGVKSWNKYLNKMSFM